jgi:glycosyl transferase, family 25
MSAGATVVDAAQRSPEATAISKVQIALNTLQRANLGGALAIFADAFSDGIDIPAERVANVMIEVAGALIKAFEFDGRSPDAYHFFGTVGPEAADVIAGLLELANFPTGHEDPAAVSEPIMLAYAGSLSAAGRHDKAIGLLARLLDEAPNRLTLNHAMVVAQRRQTDLPDDMPGPHSALIMKSFVVSLDRQPDKYEGFLRRNRDCKIAFDRFSASDGSQMSDEDVMALRLVAPGALFTKGAVGCAASHWRIWKWVVEQGVPALVFEDDATIRHDINERLATLLPTLGNWDYVALGYNIDSVLDIEFAPGMKSVMAFQPQQPDDETDAVFQRSKTQVAALRLNTCFGTAGYVVSPAGAAKLLQLCFPMDNRSLFVPLLGRELAASGIDHMMNSIYNATEAYACFAPLVVPRNDHTTSTIQTADAREWNTVSPVAPSSHKSADFPDKTNSRSKLIKRVAAQHQNWSGALLFSDEDDSVIHEEHGSRGKYRIDGEILTVFWEKFAAETFKRIDGVWVHENLLENSVCIENLGIVQAYGRTYAASRLRLVVPEARAEVELRLNSTDVPTFGQVFANFEYDSPCLPPTASTIVDLGANIGLATLYFGARYPQASILSVEPDADNFGVLLRNTQSLQQRVHRYQAAIWTHDGQINLRTEDDTNRSLGAWGIQVTASPSPGQKSVPCYRLATILDLAGFSAVDILKIDIEGAELELFSEGIDDCLSRIQMIIIETHDRFRPGSEAAVRKTLARHFEELPPNGENLFFVRKEQV